MFQEFLSKQENGACWRITADMSARKMPLHTRILIGLVLGAVAGLACQQALGTDHPDLRWWVDNVAKPIGQVFLRMIFMIVVPLLVSALILGVADIGDAKKVGRVGVRALAMTVLLSGIAVAIGLTAVNLVKPGIGLDQVQKDRLFELYADKADAQKKVEQAGQAKSVGETLLELIPANPVQEAARALEGGLLPLMVFSLIFGIALSGIAAEKALPVRAFMEGLFEVSQKVIGYAMSIAPYGVFALVFSTTALLGLDALSALGRYAVLVLVALAFHQIVTYSVVLKLIARINPLDFFRRIRTVMLTAFATSSSNATLPEALRSAREDLGLPRDISSFVLTVGATANQNGTALFEGITVLFLAQFFGITLDLGQQITVILLCVLAGVGTAGVPGGSWPMIAIVLTKVGVPPESIGLVLGIDRILDMSRTVLNVTGDLTIATCVTKMEERSGLEYRDAAG